MTWIYLDDKFHSNPKVRAADLDGSGLYARSLAFCGDHLTDGFVNTASMKQLSEHRKKVVDKCLLAGLFVAVDGGFNIPDYLEHNPSKQEVLAMREQKAEAGRKGARKRWHKPSADDGESMAPAIAPAIAEPEQSDSKPIAHAGAVPPPLPQPQKEKGAKAPSSAKLPTEAEQTVYDAWRSTFGKTDRRYDKIHADRLKPIRKALKDFSVGELLLALDGIAYETPQWWATHNDPSVVFRDSMRIEHLLDLEQRKPLPAATNGGASHRGMTPAEIVAYTKGRA